MSDGDAVTPPVGGLHFPERLRWRDKDHEAVANTAGIRTKHTRVSSEARFAPRHACGPCRLAGGPVEVERVTSHWPAERTLVFTRDFELVDVLRSSVRHLAAELLPADAPGPAAAADVIWEIDAFLSHGDRAGARRHLATRVRPILARVREDCRGHLLGIAADLDAAPY